MSRDLDAEVATKVFGFQVVGKACAIHVEGEWSIHPDSTPDGWSCYAGMEPVYVGTRCVCANGVLRTSTLAMWEGLAERHKWAAGHVSRHMEQHDREYVNGHHSSCLEVVPEYSADIRAAWRVVEKMRELGWKAFSLGAEDMQGVEPDWGATFDNDSGEETMHAQAYGETAPLAIVRAALAALNSEQQSVSPESAGAPEGTLP